MKKEIKLARLLQYVLGRRPDEFGLVPDTRGYVAVKEVIRILQEEKWAHVRPPHLESLPYRLPQAGLEMEGNRIRACDRGHLPPITPCQKVPKQLFTCVRRKAYAATAQNGLTPQAYPDRVLLFADRDLALRVGRRRDADPLVVTVATRLAQGAGVPFERFGQTVYLAPAIPVECCRLPAPPKPAHGPRTERVAETDNPPRAAGSYILDWDRLPPSAPTVKPRPQRSKQWRRERQRLRRMKRTAGNSS